MKTTKLTAANPTLVVGRYKSPDTIVTEIINEGVLCMSGKSLEGWEKAESFTWDE